MGLSVTPTKRYSGKLKVVSSKNYSGTLKVGSGSTAKYTAPVKQTYRPQPTAPRSTIQSTATARQIQNAQVAKDWATKQATRMRREEDARIAKAKLVRKRLIDAKNIEIAGNKGNWLKKLTFQSDFKARNARESASSSLKYNQENWYPSILAKQRNFERDRGQRIQDLINAGQSGKYDQDSWTKLVKEFEDWEKRTVKDLNSDITDYSTEQNQLASYSEQGINSFTGYGLGRLKSRTGDIFGKGLNVLKKITETGERSVNTVKNYANPNNLRLYYGGDEKKGGLVGSGSNPAKTAWDQLKKSYNASDDQRVFGYSKEEEANRLSGGRMLDKDGKPAFYKDHKTGELKPLTTKDATGFNEFRIKYGDDALNLMLDPLNLLPNNWFGKATKAVKKTKIAKFVKNKGSKFTDDFYKLASNSDMASNFLINRSAKKISRTSKADSVKQWLGSVVGEYHKEKYTNFYDKRLPKYQKIRNAFDADTTKNVQAMRRVQKVKAGIKDELTRSVESWNKTKAQFDSQSVVRFKNMDDDIADAVFQWRDQRLFRDGKTLLKKPNSFDGMDLSKFTTKQQHKIAKQGYRMQGTYDELYKYDKANGLHFDYRQGYNPSRKFKNSTFDPEKAKVGKPYYTKSQISQVKDPIEKIKGDALARVFGKMHKTNPYGEVAQRLTKYNKNLNEDISRYYQKLQRAKGYKRAALDKTLDPFERLVDSPFPIKPKATPLEKAERKLNRFGKVKFNAFGKERSASLRPLDLWRKSVLSYNPSWWANNIATNIPFSISAGGAGTIPEYFKMLTKKGRNFSDLPTGVRGKLDDYIGGGKLANLASNVEDTSRIAAFRAMKKQGFSDADALRDVNRWLFDYSVKNYERPIRQVAPFYKWQMNLMRQSFQMPFTRPRSAKFYTAMNDKYFRRPYEALPDQVQEYDKDGKTVSFNPKEAYKGKMFRGNDENGNPKFANAPFWAMNPQDITRFGLNPMLSSAMDLADSKDAFGNKNTDRSWLQILAEKFPQYNLANKFSKRNDKSENKWFSQSGASKISQGYDKTAPNYKQGLDNNRKWERGLKSFLGGSVFNTTTFDKKEFDKKFRLSKFNKEFFAKDWDQRLKELQDESTEPWYDFDDPKNPYNIRKSEQEGIAKQHGFDYQKDIIDDYWTKHDTQTTTRSKAKKRDAEKFSGDFWNDYLKIPAGSKTRASGRRPFLLDKYKQWSENNTFAENGYRNIPKFSVYDGETNTGEKEIRNPYVLRAQEAESVARRKAGAAKYQRYLEYQKAKKSGDWSWFEKNGGGSAKSKAYKKAKASGDWTDYRNEFGDTRKKSPFVHEGKYFKSQESMDKFVNGKFWHEYYALKTNAERQALLDKNPQFRQFDQPETQAEWDKIRSLLRKQRNEKLDKLEGFAPTREAIKKQIERGTPKGFGGRRLKYKF